MFGAVVWCDDALRCSVVLFCGTLCCMLSYVVVCGVVWGAMRCAVVRCGVPKLCYQMAMAGMPCIRAMQNGRAVCQNARCV